MAGDVVDSLMVRLGLETDQEGFDRANQDFRQLRRAAMQLGGIIGAGFGMDRLTRQFAETHREASAFAETFEGIGVNVQLVDELGFAFEQIGADASTARQSIQNVADLIERTEWGEIPQDAFREFGVDPMLLQGVEDVSEAYERLAEAGRDLDPETARRFFSSLGFGGDEARLFQQQGEMALENLMEEGRELSTITDSMIEAATEFEQASSRLSRSFEGLTNELSDMLFEELDMAGGMDRMADMLADNRDEIREFAADALPYLKAAATGVGVLVALRAGRAALGAFANIPGATALAAGVGVGVHHIMQDDGTDSDAARRGREGIEETGAILGSGHTGRRYQSERSDSDGPATIWGIIREQMGGGGDDDGGGNEPPSLELLEPPSDDGDDGGNEPPSLELPAPIPDSPVTGGVNLNIDNIDARGSSDPQATEQAVMRGMEQALSRASENTIRDLAGGAA